MSKKTILIIFIAILALVAGGLFGYYRGFYKGKDAGYDNGWQAADQRLEEIGFITPFARSREIKIINGTVEAVEGNKIKVKIKPLLPLADPDLDLRVVEVGQETKIIKMEQIPSDLSLEGFVLKETEIDISAVEPGQYISVKSEENIRDTKQFEAFEIMIASED